LWNANGFCGKETLLNRKPRRMSAETPNDFMAATVTGPGTAVLLMMFRASARKEGGKMASVNRFGGEQPGHFYGEQRLGAFLQGLHVDAETSRQLGSLAGLKTLLRFEIP
jgi:hypothetical protein